MDAAHVGLEVTWTEGDDEIAGVVLELDASGSNALVRCVDTRDVWVPVRNLRGV